MDLISREDLLNAMPEPELNFMDDDYITGYNDCLMEIIGIIQAFEEYKEEKTNKEKGIA